MQPKVSEQYEKLRELAVKSLIDCLNRLDEQAGNRMDSLVTEYNDKIEYLLEQDKIEKENLERSKLSVGTDKEKIVEYRNFLANK